MKANTETVVYNQFLLVGILVISLGIHAQYISRLLKELK